MGGKERSEGQGKVRKGLGRWEKYTRARDTDNINPGDWEWIERLGRRLAAKTEE